MKKIIAAGLAASLLATMAVGKTVNPLPPPNPGPDVVITGAAGVSAAVGLGTLGLLALLALTGSTTSSSSSKK